MKNTKKDGSVKKTATGKTGFQINSEIENGRKRYRELSDQIKSESLQEEYKRLGSVAYWTKYD